METTSSSRDLCNASKNDCSVVQSAVLPDIRLVLGFLLIWDEVMLASLNLSRSPSHH